MANTLFLSIPVTLRKQSNKTEQGGLINQVCACVTSRHRIALETHLQLVDFLVVAKERVGADTGSSLGLFLACCLSQVSPGPISLNAKTECFNKKKTWGSEFKLLQFKFKDLLQFKISKNVVLNTQHFYSILSLFALKCPKNNVCSL